MGNKGSKTILEHRRIYIGDVPEIEDEPGQNQIPRPQTITEDVEIGTGESEDEETTRRELPSRPPSVRSPRVRATSRRNSLAPKFKRGKKYVRKPQVFPSNEIKSSRYTLLTFLPKNLFEQLRRIVNFYFLCTAIIQMVIDSPVSPFTSAAPLVFVILVTAAKQGYEDWLRHKADNTVNNRPVKVVVDGSLESIKSKDVKVGNVIKLDGEEQVPCDLLVVGSSDEFLRCQITTANLDGETNLKLRYCPSGLPPLLSTKDFKNLHAVVECEQPNPDLYAFNGSLLIPQHRMLQARGSISSISFTPKNSRKSFRNGHAHSVAENGHIQESSSTEGNSSREISTEPTNDGTNSNFFQIPLSMDNMVLRGTKVKNTEYIYGLVVYTGQDTRLARNSEKTHTKFSTVEITVNRFLMVFIGVLALVVGIFTGVHFVWFDSETLDPKKAWYLPEKSKINFNYIFNIFAAFLVLFNYIIPISLYVTIELQKFIGSMFFVWDKELHCPVTGAPPLCNTSDLNEELGQIEYLFSDKTGTLTENVMQFRFCSINAHRFDMDSEDKLHYRNDETSTNQIIHDIEEFPDVRKFLRTLALCHTVQLMPIRRPSFDAAPIKNGKMNPASSLFNINMEETPAIGNGKWEYQASSPDEKALLEACYKLGVEYLGEKDDVLTVNVLGTVETFKRHFVLEFDADRKCMSVIVENSNGEYWLLTKGAESTILPNGDTGPGQKTMKHILDFAQVGMRTLAIAERKLTKEDFDTFSTELKKSRRLLKNREEKMREAYRSVESHLHILGATGVEDQLQSGVPETLTSLSSAGIRIWMLTGDKLETGVNVALSCGLITPASKQIILANFKEKEQVLRRLKEIKSEMIPDDNTTLVVDGGSLQLALDICPEIFRDVAMNATKVVCCRLTPLQKAKVVSMVKQTEKHPVTAAVGDGANDVAMILEAHIGLAILGKEGRQAARSADFAVSRFSHLGKTILVHGHWYYVRLAILGAYFFYKNVVFILPQVYYCFHSGFSTQSLFDAIFLTLFNIFFASCPIFVFGLQEQTYSAKTLMSQPHLYKEISRNQLLTWIQFFKWNGIAFWHSIVIYFFSYFAWSMMSPINDWASFGTMVFCGVVGVVNTKLFIEMRYISWLVVFSLAFSFLSFFFLTGIYTEVDLRFIPALGAGDMYGSYLAIMGTLSFWLIMILVTVTCLVPDLCLKALYTSWPTIQKNLKQRPQKTKLTKLGKKTFHLPQFSLLFSKRSGKLAVSSATLNSYLPKEEF